MVNSRAKLLLDRINKEYSLVSLKEDTNSLLNKAPLYIVLEELQKKVNAREAVILKEAVTKLKGQFL